MTALDNLRNHPQAHVGYQRWLDAFIIPLMQKTGMNIKVKRTPERYTITVKLT